MFCNVVGWKALQFLVCPLSSIFIARPTFSVPYMHLIELKEPPKKIDSYQICENFLNEK